jgi:hypothetical protein
LAVETMQTLSVPQDQTNVLGIGDTLSVDQMILDDTDWFEFVMGNCNYWPS